MGLNDVKFNIGNGGLGRTLAGEDHVSAILFSLGANNSPSAWASPLGTRYLNTKEAEAHGILPTIANMALLHHQISEYFRTSEGGELYVINTDAPNFDAQHFFAITEGRVRQAYRYGTDDFAAIEGAVGIAESFCNQMIAMHSPMLMILSVQDNATVNGASQPDLRALNCQNVSVLICGSASGTGKKLATDLGLKYIPAGGAVLGLLAKAKVHEDIAWVEKFNITKGAEFLTGRFSDGVNLSLKSDSVMDTLNSKGYLILRQHIGVKGLRLNDSATCAEPTSDFAWIENNRTMQKARRVIRASLLPDLNSPLTISDDGTLSPDTIKYFENKTKRPLDEMLRNGEISARDVYIDPSQDVLATSTLYIQVRLIPRGVARYIVVNIGFAVNFT